MWTQPFSVSAEEGFSGDVRIRYANVDDSVNDRATALTARVLLGWQSNAWRNWTANLSIEHVNDFDIDSYNDGGTNGQVQYATEADPSGTELDEAFIQYENAKIRARYGRQYINFGKLPQRYFGTAAWRQNFQTMDGFALQGKINEQLTIDAAVVERAYRVIGRRHPNRLAREFDLDGIGLMATHESESFGKLFAYIYNLDFVNNPEYSTQTIGVRGETQCLQGFGDLDLPADCEFEFARQTGIGTNPFSESYNYVRVNVGLNLVDMMDQAPINTVGVAYSNYEADLYSAFRTPLAAVHGFVGWADKILINTPVTGLVDAELYFEDQIFGWATKVIYHRFTSTVEVMGSTLDYGSEIDAVTSRTFGKYKLLFKLARYSGNEDLKPSSLANDTNKFWMQVSFSI